MGEVRQRTKKHRGKKEGSRTEAAKSESAKEKSSVNAGQNSEDLEETLWQTFIRHPLIRVGSIILIPYGIYLSYYFVLLQRPHWVVAVTNGMIQLRPPVPADGERQVLVVGSMGSGTVQIASELRSKLHLEVGHENSETEWNFVRDGTVSWFHGIRFLQPPSKGEAMSKSLSALCGNFTGNMGFHPGMYRYPEGKCSQREKWSNCWRRECFHILLREWGCASKGRCQAQFRRALHQARNPMRTIESLVAKFCQGGLEGDTHPSFLRFASALFPQHDFSTDTCIEAAAEFVIRYNDALVNAKKRGEIDGMYRIEDSSVCDVAKLAGLMSRDSTVYGPNYDKVASVCEDEMGAASDLIEQSEHKVNIELVALGWRDLQGGMHGSKREVGDDELEKKVKDMFVTLGYDASLEYNGAETAGVGIE